jgi:hypothetical protein
VRRLVQAQDVRSAAQRTREPSLPVGEAVA